MDVKKLDQILDEMIECISKIEEKKGAYYALGYTKYFMKAVAIAASFTQYGDDFAMEQLNKRLNAIRNFDKE